jgi:hypothetical protein
MEVARLVPFLESMILFSLTSNFEKKLKYELWLCHKNMQLSMDDVLKMTVADRKTYISIHNKLVEKEKEILKLNRK